MPHDHQELEADWLAAELKDVHNSLIEALNQKKEDDLRMCIYGVSQRVLAVYKHYQILPENSDIPEADYEVKKTTTGRMKRLLFGGK